MGCPIAAAGDFDGDGKVDFVFSLLQKDGGAARVAAIMSSLPKNRRWQWILDGGTTAPLNESLIGPGWMGPAGQQLFLGDASCSWTVQGRLAGFICISIEM
jgi:hypothetical protein